MIGLNIAVFLGLALALFLLIPIGNLIGRTIDAIWPQQDVRTKLINYQNEPWDTLWAARHFAEYRALRTEFFSYLGWRRRPFTGETINIDATHRIRHTPQTTAAGAPSAYFFGGSTMWGTGAPDAQTIPALFQRATGAHVQNFGESGWAAHQSLNQLIKLYVSGHRPDLVVFYDGVNDVSHKCRRENDFWSYDRQAQIRQALAHRPGEIGYYAQPVLNLARNLAVSFGPKQAKRFYDCDTNTAKAELVAEQLLADWKLAALLVQSYGGRFRAYLQPVAYFSQTRLQHLNLDPALGRQYQAIYPIFRRKMAEQGIGTDLTTALDHDAYLYIDFCHVSPNGNTLIAARIARDLAAPATN